MTISPAPSEDPKEQEEAEGQLDASEQQAEQEALDDPIKQE